MNKFAVVIPYFGKFKPSIILFLESCKRNPDIDWLIFTDCEIPMEVHISPNIKWHKTILDKVRRLAEDKLETKIKLEKPYKLCDMKPMYGVVFENYLNGYEYWGYGDTDVIYGNVYAYLKNINYSEYDKINWMGHLCFLRNKKEINRVSMAVMPNTINPNDLLSDERNFAYDERDFNRKCIETGMRIYNDTWAADIDIFYWRMRCVDLKSFHYLLDTKEIHYAPRNYSSQIFALVGGHIYRIYIKKRKICKDEFAYIHFRKEVPIMFDDFGTDSFLICRDGFMKVSQSDLENIEVVRKLINKYNSQENLLQEWKTFLYQYYRKISGKRGW